MVLIPNTKNIIQERITSYHNPNLVMPNESPNGNCIYHLYADGEITHQKGGWAYKQRSEFTVKYPIKGFKLEIILPVKCSISYAIMTEEHAIEIREMMIVENIKHIV